MGFIADEVTKVFSKALNRYAEKDGLERNDVQLRLYLNEEREVGYTICHKWQNVCETTMLEILNIKLQIFDIRGYSLLVPPFIKELLEKFEAEKDGKFAEIMVALGREEDEEKEDYTEIVFFLFIDGGQRKLALKEFIEE
jgi:hypothetical protein